jgi:hypothetical protein
MKQLKTIFIVSMLLFIFLLAAMLVVAQHQQAPSVIPIKLMSDLKVHQICQAL